ncbi:MAG: hypothetical protein OEU68_00950 [Nitrospira sp.]|nr:hypothetical protein [Nitrospira sp.]MDH4244980.1 hypothetical protein [Nitrospira sp.]MDH4354460.1 hypothetical protein [Nitrospira sp.]MDH5319227.1 hypothetical protein [Nitrospira sp.]
MRVGLHAFWLAVLLTLLFRTASSAQEATQPKESFVSPPQQGAVVEPDETSPTVDEYIRSNPDSDEIPTSGTPLKDICKIEYPSTSTPLIRKIGYVTDVIGVIDMGLGVFGKELLPFLGLKGVVAIPVIAQLGLFANLGAPHAEAANVILKREVNSGFSKGVVLAADGRKLSYAAERFWKYTIMVSPMLSGYENQFLNAHNRAMVIGHKAMARCHLTKLQQKQFVQDLWSRMTVTPDVEFGKDWRKWSDRDWTNYYIGLAAVFIRDHLK